MPLAGSVSLSPMIASSGLVCGWTCVSAVCADAAGAAVSPASAPMAEALVSAMLVATVSAIVRVNALRRVRPIAHSPFWIKPDVQEFLILSD